MKTFLQTTSTPRKAHPSPRSVGYADWPVWVKAVPGWFLLFMVCFVCLFGSAYASNPSSGTVGNKYWRLTFDLDEAAPDQWSILGHEGTPVRDIIDPILADTASRPFGLLLPPNLQKYPLRYQLHQHTVEQDVERLVFRAKQVNTGLIVEKHVEVSANQPTLEMSLVLRNEGEQSIALGDGSGRMGFSIGPGLGRPPSMRSGALQDGRDGSISAIYSHGDSFQVLDNLEALGPWNEIELGWAAILDSHYIVAIQNLTPGVGLIGVPPEKIHGLATVRTQEQLAYYPSFHIVLPVKTLASMDEVRYPFTVFVGPKTLPELDELGIPRSSIYYPGLPSAVGAVCHWLENLMDGLADWVGGWGIALILCGTLGRVVTLPMSIYGVRQQQLFNANMEKIQPKLVALKEKYKDRPAMRDEAIYQLQKRNGITPLNQMKGCLPLLVQLPILIVLLQILLYSPALHGESFLWAEDLSLPDRLMQFGVQLPWLGSYLNAFPLVMFVVQVGIAYSLKVRDEHGRSKLEMKDMAMPLFMTVAFYPFPSGCMLYWTTTNIMQLVEHMLFGQARSPDRST